jgi:hypothetical protein
MSEQLERIFVGVPAEEVEGLTNSLSANGAISVVKLPEPSGTTFTLIGTLADDRSHFRTVGEYAKDFAASRVRGKAMTAN